MSAPDLVRWKVLSPRLDSLLDLEPADRRLRLADLREQDAALADDLESMIRAADQARAERFLSCPIHDNETMAASLVGKKIDAYVIEALLGQGGAGSVWRARRADGRFEGTVAIKLLHLSQIGRVGAQRFQREGAILARLTHPNIARMLDAGVTDDGQPYLVLEVVEGTRIDHHCDARGLNIRQRLVLFRDVLAAVAHAHNHLVIHRDIRPNNVFVTSDGTVKLLDFGIAKLLQSEIDGVAVTAEGHRALTPQYAAPEQLQGGAITTATDVYALGVLLYQLLAGRHPTSSELASPAEVMRATLEVVPPRLSVAVTLAVPNRPEAARPVAVDRATTLPRLRRQLQGDLDNIVARALRKDPAQRYQTVTALGEDLRRYLAHEPVSARPDSLAYRCGKFLRRHHGQVGAGLLVLLATVAGVAGTVSQAHRAEVEAAHAKDERDNALRQLAYAQSSGEFVSFLLQEGSDKPFTTAELLARAEPVMERQSLHDPAQRAYLRLTLANLFAQANYREKATALLLRARTDAMEVSDSSLQAEIDCLLALEHGSTGAFDLAQPMFDGAIAKLRAAPELNRSTLALCLQSRSEVAGARGQAKVALVDAQAAMAAIGDATIIQGTQPIVLRATLATALGRVGQAADSVRESRRAITELDAMGRGHTLQALGLYNNMGVQLSRAGQTLEAVDAYRQALGIARGLGSAEPALEGNYANKLIELGRSVEAMPMIEHAVSEAKARRDTRTGPSILALGARAWCVVNDLARCAELLSTARLELTAMLPAGHSLLGTLEMTQAQLALARSDLHEAGARLKRAVAVFDGAAERNRYGIRALTLLARTQLQLGEIDAAEANARRAVAQAREAMAGFAHSEWLGSALVAQGLVQQARGDALAAQASWQAARVELQATVGESAPATADVRRLLADSIPPPARVAAAGTRKSGSRQ
jgi:serine/threonine protein kinase/tetratricopeptide (TPR) repeat protein